MIIWVMHSLAEGENENWSFEGAFYHPCKALRKAIERQVRKGCKGDVKVSYRSSIYERHLIDNVEFEITKTEIQ